MHCPFDFQIQWKSQAQKGKLSGFESSASLQKTCYLLNRGWPFGLAYLLALLVMTLSGTSSLEMWTWPPGGCRRVVLKSDGNTVVEQSMLLRNSFTLICGLCTVTSPYGLQCYVAIGIFAAVRGHVARQWIPFSLVQIKTHIWSSALMKNCRNNER